MPPKCKRRRKEEKEEESASTGDDHESFEVAASETANEEEIAKMETKMNDETRGVIGGKGDKISGGSDSPRVERLIEIPEGNGIPLGKIPIIYKNIQNTEPEHLVVLYRVLFGRVEKHLISKTNIMKFNGFDFHQKSYQYFTKRGELLGFKLRVLRNMCALLGLGIVKEREDMAQNILNFLMNPGASGNFGKSQGRKVLKGYRGKLAKCVIQTESSDDDSDYGHNEVRNSSVKENEEIDFDNQEQDRDDEGDANKEENFQKQEEVQDKALVINKFSSKKMCNNKNEKKERRVKQMKNENKRVSTSPHCSGETKVNVEDTEKRNDEKDKEDSGEKHNERNLKIEEGNNTKKSSNNITKKRKMSTDGEPRRKKPKQMPSDTEIRQFLKEFLEGADLDQTPMTTILRKLYDNYPGIDFSRKKDFVKENVIYLVNTMQEERTDSMHKH